MRGWPASWANIDAPDAAALDQRLDALAGSVCADDPRTQVQRRADAVGAVADGLDRLGAGARRQDFPAASAGAPAGAVVIHVLAEQATVDGAGDAPGICRGSGSCRPSRCEPWRSRRGRAADGADGAAGAGYRPSAALAEFVRWRDLTCRFPGCDAPAAVCDIDHTVPYPRGATHPSNDEVVLPRPRLGQYPQPPLQVLPRPTRRTISSVEPSRPQLLSQGWPHPL